MTYDDWNRQIAEYFVGRVAPGALVYLTVDDELLWALGEEGGIDAEEAVAGFRDAVRSRVWVGGADEISLSGLVGHDTAGCPRGVAFLALMVLAANRMGNHEISEINYFTQFRKLLRLDTERKGRPHGMTPAGVEVPLWRDWVRYLEWQGRFSSARRGSGPQTYINYPVSQTLLRFADHERLKELFGSSRYFLAYREPDLLMARVVASREQLTSRLRSMLRETGDRYAALTQAVFDLHEEFLCQSASPGESRGGTSLARIAPSMLTADLMRVPGVFPRPARYELVPRLKLGFAFGTSEGSPQIQIAGAWLPLRRDPQRPGAALPIGPLLPQQIVQGSRFALGDAGRFTEVVLPQRPFYVLASDPDQPGYGVYASGRLPAPDTHFLFLGSREALADLYRLREMGKVDWKKQRPLGDTDWIEVDGCMILTRDWTQARLGNAELFNALRPQRTVTIGVSGGLRAPGGFLSGIPPTLTVYGTQPSLPARILDISGEDEKEVWADEVDARRPMPLPAGVAGKPGSYRVEVGEGDEPERRLLRIVDWDEIRSVPITFEPGRELPPDPLRRVIWMADS